MSGAKVLASGTVLGCYSATGPRSGGFVTARVPALALDRSGIAGDRHAGLTRAAGPREPWLRRGLELSNDRQLSVLSQDELAVVAGGLGLGRLAPELLGANLLLGGVQEMSRLPPGAVIACGGQWAGRGQFDGTALLRVEAYNRPCRATGRQIAAAHGKPDLEFAFVKVAASLRGLVLSVVHPGVITPGDAVVVIAPLRAP
jgi:hypothetical protein